MSALDLQHIHVARQQVFVVEQACAFQDADEADGQAWHLSAWAEAREVPGKDGGAGLADAVGAARDAAGAPRAGGPDAGPGPRADESDDRPRATPGGPSRASGAELLAYARIVDPGVKYLEPSIGRVLTTAAARGTGLGRLLLARAIAQAEAFFPGQGLRISAQHRLERFYAEAGFITVGVPYLEDDLPHIEMWRA